MKCGFDSRPGHHLKPLQMQGFIHFRPFPCVALCPLVSALYGSVNTTKTHKLKSASKGLLIRCNEMDVKNGEIFLDRVEAGSC